MNLNPVSSPNKCLGCATRDGDLYALGQRFDDILGREIQKRRKEQDAKWGGPEHDDTHVAANWLRMIDKFREQAGRAINHDEIHEDFLIDIAALCIAAIQSSRRKRND